MLTVDSAKERFTSEHTLRNGAIVVFRSIECSDQERFKEFFKSLSPDSIHFRFLEMMKELPTGMVEQYCNLDYNKEGAIVSLPNGKGRIVTVGNLIVDRAQCLGEFALTVADAWQGRGLDRELLSYLIKIAKDYELSELICLLSTIMSE